MNCRLRILVSLFFSLLMILLLSLLASPLCRLCFDDRDVFTMSTPRNVTSKHHRPEKVFGQGGGPSWILIAGGALLSTLSIRFGYKLKQSLHFKPPPHQSNASVGLKGYLLALYHSLFATSLRLLMESLLCSQWNI